MNIYFVDKANDTMNERMFLNFVQIIFELKRIRFNESKRLSPYNPMTNQFSIIFTWISIYFFHFPSLSITFIIQFQIS